MEIILTNRPDERMRLFQALDTFAIDQRLPLRVRQAVDLALEEHLTNVLTHGYTDSSTHEIRLRFSCDANCLVVEVEDDGRPFDPLEAPAPDTSAPLESRPLGGWGIHLMRQFMDRLEYRRERRRNILRMTKLLQDQAPASQ